MDRLWLPLFAVLLQTSSSSSFPVRFVPVGGSVTFRIHSLSTGPALWNFGGETIVAVDFWNNSQPVSFEDKFKPRLTISEWGRALSISQLRTEDSGIYSVTINKTTSTFPLRVLSELAEPTVTCERRNCSGGSCSFSLRCSVSGSGPGDTGDDVGNVSYTWRVGAGPWGKGSAELLLENSTEDGPEALACAATNAVSSRNVTVAGVGQLCAGALSARRVGIEAMAAIVALVLALLLLLVLCKSRGCRKFHLLKSKPTDPATASTNVYALVGAAQQHVPKGMRGAAPDPPHVVYSLVKSPERVGAGTEEDVTVSGLELV